MLRTVSFGLEAVGSDTLGDQGRGNSLRTLLGELLVRGFVARVIGVPADLQANSWIGVQDLDQVVQLGLRTRHIQISTTRSEGDTVEIEPCFLIDRFTASQESNQATFHPGGSSGDLLTGSEHMGEVSGGSFSRGGIACKGTKTGVGALQ